VIDKSTSQTFSANFIRTISFVLAFAIIAGVGLVVYYLISSILRLATLNLTVATAFVTGAVTIVASVSAVVVGRYFEKRKEVEQAFRERRLQAYERFVSRAGPRLLKAYTTFLQSAKDAYAGKSFFMLEDFYRAMREDLGHSNRGIQRGDILTLILKGDELEKLLAGMQKDPHYRVPPSSGLK